MQGERVIAGERSLWCAVIERAIEDRSRDWFNTYAFKIICSYLNLPEKQIRAQALKVAR